MSSFKDIKNVGRIKRLKKFRPTMSLLDTIEYCIEKNFKLDFLYQDDEGNDKVLSGYRSVSPAAVGRHKDTGNKVLRAYLQEGVSKTEKDPKWRMFRLDRIKQFNIHYQKNKVGQNKLFRPDDAHMDVIYSEIKKAFDDLIC